MSTAPKPPHSILPAAPNDADQHHGLIPPRPRTIGEAVEQMHHAGWHMDEVISRLEQLLLDGRDAAPELRTPVINPQALSVGPFWTIDQAAWRAKSIGVLNTSAFAVSLGLDGGSVASNARAIQVPAQTVLVLPIPCGDLTLGTTSTLGAASLPVFVFRYQHVQPLAINAA